MLAEARHKPIVVKHHELGSRVYILGCRVHHGLCGAVVLVAGVSIGVALMYSDRHDFPWLLDNEPVLFEKVR